MDVQQQGGFEELSLDAVWVNKLSGWGITQPTAVQQQAIPAILQGRDVIAQSQTGTGKTLAYLLPLLQRLDAASKHLQVLILVPTRELGMQIISVADKLAEGTGIRTQSLIGGASIQRQIDKLKGNPHLVVGTPGRIAELLKLRKLSMHYVRSAVIDEVDQVFELGSARDMDTVLKGMLKTSQLLFFSATITKDIELAADRLMKEPVTVRINPSQRTSETVEHVFYVCERRDKIDILRRLIRMYNPRSAIVFINATDDVAEVIAKLQYTGLKIEALYGEAGKQARATVMHDFRQGKFQLLLATDIAARGLDIEGVSHVFHLTPAVSAEYYLHRIGRTGRMGRSGYAVSIVTPQELFIMDKFSKSLGIHIKHKAMHEGKEVDPGSLPERKRDAFEGKGQGSKAGGERAKAGSYKASSGAQEGRGSSQDARRAGIDGVEGASRQRSERRAEERRSERGAAQPISRGGAEVTGKQAGEGEGKGPERRPNIGGDERPSGARSAKVSSAGGAISQSIQGAKQEQGRKKSEPDRRSKSQREKERKNKGAPKWLKEKQQEDPK